MGECHCVRGMGGRVSLCPWDGWESVTVSVGWVGEYHCVRGMGERESLCPWDG